MAALVIDTQSLRLQWIRWHIVASFLSARYGDLNVGAHGGDAAHGARSWLWGGRPVGSIQL